MPGRVDARHTFYLLGLILIEVCFTMPQWVSAAHNPRRPNVLFIAIEDASPGRFGCYGNTVCKTPNLDRFAASGLRFDACHTYPPCCPSRTPMLLAKRPPTTHVFGNRSDWRALCPGAVTMPAWFRQNGYATIRCGKIFHGSFEDKGSWDRVIRERDGMPRPEHRRRRLEGPARTATQQELAGSGSPFLYGPTGLDDTEETDGMLATQAVRVLDRRSATDKPMLLALGFHAPHLPFAAPDKYVAILPAGRVDAASTDVEIDRTRLKSGGLGQVLERGGPGTTNCAQKSVSCHKAWQATRVRVQRVLRGQF